MGPTLCLPRDHERDATPIFRNRVRAGFQFPSARFAICLNAKIANQCLGLSVYVFNPRALARRPREHSQLHLPQVTPRGGQVRLGTQFTRATYRSLPRRFMSNLRKIASVELLVLGDRVGRFGLRPYVEADAVVLRAAAMTMWRTTVAAA